MRLVLVADTFPPLRTSGALQLSDLCLELASSGYEVHVLIPEPDQRVPWSLSVVDGINLVRLRSPRMKDLGYARRAVSEFLMPFFMLWNLLNSPLKNKKWDAIIWYSPSIFHGPLIKGLKYSSACPSYLILRDIFPEWALDMGLMKRGLTYFFLKCVARYQYSIADVIGIQAAGNAKYLQYWQARPGRRLEVLPNWLGPPKTKRCRIRVEDTKLAGRKILVYAGNMGVAQNLSIFLRAASFLEKKEDFGFLMVGRGSELEKLKSEAAMYELDNVLFFDEIHPDEISDLYSQCVAGIVALDARHKSHNIPGKFLTYMQSGLPVVANINPGNELASMIEGANVGQVCEEDDAIKLALKIKILLAQVETDTEIADRCRLLFSDNFTSKSAVSKIVNSLEALAERH